MSSRTLHRAVAGALLALVVAACSSTAPTAEPQPTLRATPGPTAGPVSDLPIEVDVATAAEMRDAGAFVLDVRELDEWVTGHIPDATLISLGSLGSRVADVPADRDIVVVCRSGNRSAQGRDILLNAGLTRVTSMAGGMNEWAAAGLPTVTGE